MGKRGDVSVKPSTYHDRVSRLSKSVCPPTHAAATSRACSAASMRSWSSTVRMIASCPPRSWHARLELAQPSPSSGPVLITSNCGPSVGSSGAGGAIGGAGGDGGMTSHTVTSLASQ